MKKLKNILSITLLIILLPILFISVVILINSYTKPKEIPSFFGYKPFIVLSGSMESEINSGDIAVAKEIDVIKLKKGDIIAFRSGKSVITHRIVDIIDENGVLEFVTKGDNNNNNDKNVVTSNNVEGKYVFRLKGVGNFAMFLQTPLGMIIFLSIPVILLFMIESKENKSNSEKNKEEQ